MLFPIVLIVRWKYRFVKWIITKIFSFHKVLTRYDNSIHKIRAHGVIFAFYSNLPSLSLSLSLQKKRNFANSFQRNSLIFARTQVSNFWNIYKATLEFYKTQTRQGTWKVQNYGGFFPPQRGGIERRGSVATGSRNFSWLAWFIACKSVNKSKPCVVGLACVVVRRGGARN